jgi:hypothetical protein
MNHVVSPSPNALGPGFQMKPSPKHVTVTAFKVGTEVYTLPPSTATASSQTNPPRSRARASSSSWVSSSPVKKIVNYTHLVKHVTEHQKTALTLAARRSVCSLAELPQVFDPTEVATADFYSVSVYTKGLIPSCLLSHVKCFARTQTEPQDHQARERSVHAPGHHSQGRSAQYSPLLQHNTTFKIGVCCAVDDAPSLTPFKTTLNLNCTLFVSFALYREGGARSCSSASCSCRS